MTTQELWGAVGAVLRGNGQQQDFYELEKFMHENKRSLAVQKTFKNFLICAYDHYRKQPGIIQNGQVVNITEQQSRVFLQLLALFQPYATFLPHYISDYISVDEQAKLEYIMRMAFLDEGCNIRRTVNYIDLLYGFSGSQIALFKSSSVLEEIVRQQIARQRGDALLVVLVRLYAVLQHINYRIHSADWCTFEANQRMIVSSLEPLFVQNISCVARQLFEVDLRQVTGEFDQYIGNYLYILKERSESAALQVQLYPLLQSDQFTVYRYLASQFAEKTKQGLLEQIIFGDGADAKDALDRCLELDLDEEFGTLRENTGLQFTDALAKSYRGQFHVAIDRYMDQYHDTGDYRCFAKANYISRHYQDDMCGAFVESLIASSTWRVFNRIRAETFHDGVQVEAALFGTLNGHASSMMVQQHINNLQRAAINKQLNGRLMRLTAHGGGRGKRLLVSPAAFFEATNQQDYECTIKDIYKVDIGESSVRVAIQLDYDESYEMVMAADLYLALSGSPLLPPEDIARYIVYLEQIGFLAEGGRVREDFDFALYRDKALQYDAQLGENKASTRLDPRAQGSLPAKQRLQAIIMRRAKLGGGIPSGSLVEQATLDAGLKDVTVAKQVIGELIDNMQLTIDDRGVVRLAE